MKLGYRIIKKSSYIFEISHILKRHYFPKAMSFMKRVILLWQFSSKYKETNKKYQKQRMSSTSILLKFPIFVPKRPMKLASAKMQKVVPVTEICCGWSPYWASFHGILQATSPAQSLVSYYSLAVLHNTSKVLKKYLLQNKGPVLLLSPVNTNKELGDRPVWGSTRLPKAPHQGMCHSHSAVRGLSQAGLHKGEYQW